jgi:hypothetical protein
MEIDSNMVINNQVSGSPTGLIFVVKGDPSTSPDGVTIARAVNRVDGVFVVNNGKQFNTGGASCGSNSSGGDPALAINGAVYSFGQACFTRSLDNNMNDPAETINFEPKYLWLFKDTIGDPKVVYREVAP